MSDILSQMRWPSLAQDLASMMVPGTPVDNLGFIYSKYGLNEQELRNIFTVPAFMDMFHKELDYFKAQGSKAGPMCRAGVLVQPLMQKLFNDAMNPEARMDTREAIKLLELLLRVGKYLEKESGPTTVNVQTNVGLHSALPQGLSNPKLSHIKAPEAIDV